MDVKATQEEEEEEDLFVFNDTIEGPNLEAREAFENLRTAHFWTLPDTNFHIPDINFQILLPMLSPATPRSCDSVSRGHFLAHARINTVK